ncbi:MAG: hypothetical protein FIB07_02945 [Candidatus Methanoperedens sp.]|nr:hypothetical protein [Candidatus Methanoperedens sp.]
MKWVGKDVKNMTNKLVILGIAILAIGLVALPETLALFAGQHNWYDVDKTNTTDMGVPCAKCHADVQQQMDAMGGNGAHADGQTTCVECHITSQTELGAIVSGNSSGNIHAAAAPACMDCHGVSGNIFAAPMATSIYNGSKEAHKDFVNSANATQGDLMEGSNEACIGCHTHVAVTITWNKPTRLSFIADSNETGVWTVSNFQSSGVNTTVTNSTAEY